MSWKKNVFSYPLWALYTVAVEVGLVFLTDAFCDSMGWEIRMGTVVCALYVVAAGVIVFLIHRFAPKYDSSDGKCHTARTMTEAAVAVTLLALGLVFRVRAIGTEITGMQYYEAALVSGDDIPQIAHGAVFVYLQMLRILFFFLGNKFMTAVWAQIVLQLAGMLVLYFAVRRLAGNIAALVMLSFGMFSSYLIQEAVILSPSMLYLLVWALALFLVSVGAIEKRSVGWHFSAGIVISLVCYLDVAGCLVLLMEAALLFRREDISGKSGRIRRLLFCLAGAGVGFCGAGLADALMSGKEFVRVLDAWLQQYRPLEFQLPLTLERQGMPAEYLVLFCVLTLGVFSFWRSRRKDYMKVWFFLLIVLVTAGCFDVFTREVPMGLYMYLLLAIMAGVVVEECIRREAAVQPIKAGEAAAALEQGRNGGAAAVSEQKSAEKVAAQERQSAGETAAPERTPAVEKAAPERQPAGESEVPAQMPPQHKPVQMIENPLPLPKKHVKKTLDYSLEVSEGKDDFDLDVADGDDFDI